MSSDQKTWLLTCFMLCVVVMCGMGGCTYSEVADNKHREKMANEGFQEVFELMPGEDSPVRYWRRIE